MTLIVPSWRLPCRYDFASYDPASGFWMNRANASSGAYFTGTLPTIATDPPGVSMASRNVRREECSLLAVSLPW